MTGLSAHYLGLFLLKIKRNVMIMTIKNDCGTRALEKRAGRWRLAV
jgi:hypothetical protein